MSGVKGMKGGGGARPNSGPKKKPPQMTIDRSVNDLLGEDPAQKSADAPTDPETTTVGEVPEDISPLAFLQAVYRSKSTPDNTRLRAAIAAAQYCHTRRSDGGKKESQKDEAAKVGKQGNRFGKGTAPTLAVNNQAKAA